MKNDEAIGNANWARAVIWGLTMLIIVVALFSAFSPLKNRQDQKKQPRPEIVQVYEKMKADRQLSEDELEILLAQLFYAEPEATTALLGIRQVELRQEFINWLKRGGMVTGPDTPNIASIATTGS